MAKLCAMVAKWQKHATVRRLAHAQKQLNKNIPNNPKTPPESTPEEATPLTKTVVIAEVDAIASPDPPNPLDDQPASLIQKIQDENLLETSRNGGFRTH